MSAPAFVCLWLAAKRERRDLISAEQVAAYASWCGNDCIIKWRFRVVRACVCVCESLLHGTDGKKKIVCAHTPSVRELDGSRSTCDATVSTCKLPHALIACVCTTPPPPPPPARPAQPGRVGAGRTCFRTVSPRGGFARIQNSLHAGSRRSGRENNGERENFGNELNIRRAGSRRCSLLALCYNHISF